MHISISQNSESMNINKGLLHRYTINSTKICSDNLDQLTNKGLFRIKYNN